MTHLLRFKDLKERGIVANWVTLRRWIEREQFPRGRMTGPNTRTWPEAEVEDWLRSRPVDRAERDHAARREPEAA